jgi:hypothetical protein
MSRVLAICCVFLLAPARDAASEWQITPMVGLTMLGSTSLVDVELGSERRHWNFGGAVTLVGSGILGVEVITAWTPGFFERGDLDEADPLDVVDHSRTVSLMANVVLTTPRRWTEYFLRPFVSGGLGLMHVAKTDEGLFPVDLNVVGFNIGGGAIGFLTNRTGLRFDLRYHGILNPSDHGPIAFEDVRLRYMTASIGIVFRR